MTTLTTHSRGVLWGNQLYSDPFCGSLVGNAECEFTIRPTINLTAKLLSLFQRSVSNVRQIFKHNLSCTDGLGPLHKSFRSNMHGMSGYGCLVPRHSFEKLSGRTGSNRLYFGSGSSNVRKLMIEMVRFVKQVFVWGRCYKKSFDALVDTNNASFFGWLRNFNFIRKIHIPLAVFKEYFRILPIIWNRPRILKCDRVSPKSNSFFGSCKISFPDNGDRFLFVNRKIPLLLSFHRFVSSRNGSEKSAGKLGWKAELFSNNFVIRLGKSIRINFFGLEDYFRKPIAGIKPIWKNLISLMIA